MHYRILCKWNTHTNTCNSNMQVKTNLQRIGKIFAIISWKSLKMIERLTAHITKYTRGTKSIQIFFCCWANAQCTFVRICATLWIIYMHNIITFLYADLYSLVWKCLYVHWSIYQESKHKKKPKKNRERKRKKMNIYTNNLQIAYA